MVEDTPQLRPTPDKVRETLFNWLMHDVVSARCLDLFAGTGILGIEALSRGAAFVSFVEQDPKLTKRITQTLTALAVDKSEATVFLDNAMRWLDRQSSGDAYDIIFLDPPYQLPIYPLLNKIAEKNMLAQNAILYIEQGTALKNDLLPASWSVSKYKNNGQVHYHLILCEA